MDGDHSTFRQAFILGKSAKTKASIAKDLITRFEAFDIDPHDFDFTGKLKS